MGCERPRSRRGQPEPSTKSGGSKGHHAPRPSNGGPSRAQHPTISRAVEPHRHSVDATTVIPVDRNEPLTRERVDNATMSASQVETVVPLAVDPVDFRALIAELVGASVATGSATLALVVWVLENIGYWTGRFVLSYKRNHTQNPVPRSRTSLNSAGELQNGRPAGLTTGRPRVFIQ